MKPLRIIASLLSASVAALLIIQALAHWRAGYHNASLAAGLLVVLLVASEFHDLRMHALLDEIEKKG